MQANLFTVPEENVYRSFYDALSIFRPKEELTVSEWSNKFRTFHDMDHLLYKVITVKYFQDLSLTVKDNFIGLKIV